MSLLRSQTMEYCHLICNEDHAWEVLNEIGDLKSMHFVDPDPSLPIINRPFSNYVKRCDEIEIKLNYIREQGEKFETKFTQCNDYKEILKYFKDVLQNRAVQEGKKDGKTYFFDIENEVNEQHTWLTEQLRHFENLTEQKNSLKEYKAVLFNAQQMIGDNFFPQSGGYQGEENPNDQSNFGLQQDRIGMNQIVGVIDSAEALRFERMVFRVTKGNAFIRIQDIDWQGDYLYDPKTLQSIEKKVFVIIYPGGTQDIIKNKLNRICDSFSCSRYGFPGDQTQFLNKIAEIDNQKKDSDNLCQMTKNNLLQFLKTWAQIRNGAGCSKLEEYSLYVCKEQSLYSTLNLLKTDKAIYQGHAWVPQQDVEAITKALQLLSSRNDTGGAQINPGQQPPAGQSPPSSFITNEFTTVYQMITDTYGVPRYKEINPSLFSLMTFPFLFGVMFGDMGHGGLLMLFGIFLLIKNESLKSTPMATFANIRYFIFFMGFFAFYCGFIYNDFMSLSFDFFGSCYEAHEPMKGKCYPPNSSDRCYAYKPEYQKQEGHSVALEGCVYPFGVDPVWSIAGNNIAFMNSYKMKLAVIFGVTQMLLGIVLKGWNALHFKEPLDFIFEFLPQIIFMTCTFGYMDFMIIYKWFLNFTGDNAAYAPSIITLLINMPLAGGAPGGEPAGENPYLYGNQDGSTQQSVQTALLLTALLMVPTMLLPKPIILYFKNKNSHHDAIFTGEKSMGQPLLENEHQEYDGAIQNKASSQYGLGKSLEDNLQEQAQQEAAVQEEAHGFGELFVHQVIETIEFVLGSISNTASYLRLWALSLAHSQLADVFFSKGMEPFIEMGGVGGGFALVIGFYVFAMITFGVLMCMDVMECFLHALRLHWVEFQNKFYKADGQAFEPFSFVDHMSQKKTVE